MILLSLSSVSVVKLWLFEGQTLRLLLEPLTVFPNLLARFRELGGDFCGLKKTTPGDARSLRPLRSGSTGVG